MALQDPRQNANQSYDLEGRIPITVKDTPIGNTAPHPVTLSYAQWVYEQEAAHAAHIVQLREYYDGEQESFLTDRQREYLEVNHDIKFRLNAMPIPVDIQAERMRVIAFDVSDKEDAELENPQSGENGFLWMTWQRNRMDAEQIATHKSAGRDGDTYGIVGWDVEENMSTIHHEMAWDGANGVVVRYRPDDRKKVWYAAKRWTIDQGGDVGKKVYMTIYTDDAIANFIGNVGNGDWEALPDETGEYIKPWVDKTGQPLGVPVFHVANNDDGTGYGRSELEDLLPLQNALDKVVIDELGIADLQGFPIPWASGLGVNDSPVISPGTLLSTQNPDAKFGSIQAADVKSASELVTQYVTRIAQVSRTPLTFFQVTGQVSNADTQKAGDSPLVSKVRARAVSMGNFWEDVMYMCRKLHNTFSTDGVTYEENIITTVWDSFESIDVKEEEKQTAETQNTKADSLTILIDRFPFADPVKLALRAGYNQDEAQTFNVPTTGFVNDGLEQ